MNETDITVFTLCFFKNKRSVFYPWDQPKLPWMILKKADGSTEMFKVLCDYNTHRIYLKVERDDWYKIVPIQNFMSETFGIPQIDIVGRYDECLFELIDDLRRNLHNRQGQLIKFEVQRNQFGYSKINGAKKRLSSNS